MRIPEGIFAMAVWAAYIAVAAGSVYLLIVLVGEWIRKELW